ncbi:ABC transporter permease [Hyphomicrobium sp.]|uniref:ABC transporter permease n=1 Tax=Hyphomicrobium sp. TaxID=82 RepID=UPI003F7271EA
MSERPKAAGPFEALRGWLAARRGAAHAPGWGLTVAVLLALIALPAAAVLVIAATPENNDWPHLARSVLPEALKQTLLLGLGASLLTLATGTATAWLVTMYRFPGRVMLDRLLVLPLAIPTYIAAYCYSEFLDYAGPVQTTLRELFGWTSVNDYWFPSVRSLGGAVFVMSAVLYPYVYLAARASFVQQSVCALEVARTLGRTPMGTFWAVALPLSRPALAAGVALVVMETLNDLGAVQHLGVETLTASIYATWLQRSNLGGAAQIATVILGLIVLLFAAERFARGGAKVHHTTGRYRAIPFQDIEGWRGYAAAGLCALPFVAGFVLPFLLLARFAVSHVSVAIEGGFLSAAWNSIFLASVTAAAATALALVFTYAPRVARSGLTRFGQRAAGFGYALPGTVLAIGVLVPLAAFDNFVDGWARSLLGLSTGLILSGSIAALVYAYVIRFLAVALGGIEAGLERISHNLDAAARALGETAVSALWRVHLPMLVPSLGVAALLVFVDALKELPATLLLRPFNFETLATHVYAFAALEQIESGALGALTIVLAGLVPLILLHRAIAGGRAGGSGET